MHISMYTHIYIYVYMYVCMSARAYVHMRACVQRYVSIDAAFVNSKQKPKWHSCSASVQPLDGKGAIQLQRRKRLTRPDTPKP